MGGISLPWVCCVGRNCIQKQGGRQLIIQELTDFAFRNEGLDWRVSETYRCGVRHIKKCGGRVGGKKLITNGPVAKVGGSAKRAVGGLRHWSKGWPHQNLGKGSRPCSRQLPQVKTGRHKGIVSEGGRGLRIRRRLCRERLVITSMAKYQTSPGETTRPNDDKKPTAMIIGTNGE